MKNQPLLAESLLIEQEPEKIGEYVYEITNKFVYETAKQWNDFMIDALYKTYKKLGVSHVLLICEEDFERYLKETLPGWIEKERGITMTKQEKIKKVQEIINREKLDAEKIYAICMYPRGMANEFNLTDLSPEEHDLVKYCFTHYPVNLFKLY